MRAIASQSRETASLGGKPGKIFSAQPALAAATIAQFVSLRDTCSRNGRISRAVACSTALTRSAGSP